MRDVINECSLRLQKNIIIKINFQEHKEVGLVEKVFWCVPLETPMFAWRGHEVYFLMIILVKNILTNVLPIL